MNRTPRELHPGGGPPPTGLEEPPAISGLKKARLTWAAQWGAAGVPRADVRRLIADLTDRTLQRHWDQVTVDLFASRTRAPAAAGNHAPQPPSDAAAAVQLPGRLALAAVGSLGRRDGGPASDLDLVLLHDVPSSAEQDVAALAQALWYPLWDSGLDLDHSVRSLPQCREIAATDLAAVMGLLDLRVIAGDGDLVAHVRQQVGQDWRSQARRRFGELTQSLVVRQSRFGELAYLQEPNLKEARGGLRDVVIAQALSATWLADRPHGALDHANAAVLDVRDALQLVTGRHSPLLGFADQDEVAASLGVADADALLALLAEAGRTIAFSLDTTMRRARQVLPSTRPARPVIVRGRRTGPRVRPVAPWVITYQGETALANGADLRSDPAIALRAAAYAATSGLPLSPVTQEYLAGAGRLPEPWPAAVRASFFTLLGAGPGLIPTWEALDQAGLIVRWIPAWAAVRNLPQRNPVHRHTVDRHLVETVARLTSTEPRSGSSALIAPPDELLAAALLHDIGKGPGVSHHAQAGAAAVPAIVQPWGMSRDASARVVFLVRHHLAIADAATHRDPGDPAVAHDMAQLVGRDALLFDMLAALTRADAQAAGSQAWSTVRAALIEQLIGATQRLLAG